jgi:5-methylcytosine-specific restriction endonuclease McrA
MIHVSLDDIKAVIPADWFPKATAAMTACAAETDRGKYIKDNDSLWRDLKPVLAAVRAGKCWYCESKNDRADNAVDHFRPKNAVAECKTHGGYWWRAFDWENYRFSCQFCNSRRIDVEHGTDGGKQDHFPLFDEARRAARAEDEGNEQPLLLDPCYEGDAEYLWFNDDGSPAANPELCGDPQSYPSKRVEESIHWYHLDHHALVEGRIGVYQGIRKKLSHADAMLLKIRAGDMTARESYATAINELRALTERSKPYSATAKCALLGMRGKSPSAEAALR